MSKLHSSFLYVLLNISSKDGDRAAKDITATCRSFFSQDIAGLVDQQLLVLLRELGFPDVGFAHGFFQAFLSGHFCTMSLAVLTISQYSVSMRNYATLLTTRGAC